MAPRLGHGRGAGGGGGGGEGGWGLNGAASQAAVSQAGLRTPPMEGERDEESAWGENKRGERKLEFC